MFFDTTTHGNGEKQTLYRLLGTSVCSLVMMPLVSHEFDDWSEVMYLRVVHGVDQRRGRVGHASINADRVLQREPPQVQEVHDYAGDLRGLRADGQRADGTASDGFPIRPSRFVRSSSCAHERRWSCGTFTTTTGNRFWWPRAFCSTIRAKHERVPHRIELRRPVLRGAHEVSAPVNEELRTLDGQLNRERNKWQLHTWAGYGSRRSATADDDGSNVVTSSSSSVVVYEKDFYRSQQKGCPMANAVELLTIKHWITREAVHDLNGLFGITMGLCPWPTCW